MALNPGLFTDWPWKKLGNFKYLLLAPWMANSVYSNMKKGKEGEGVDMFNLCIVPMQVIRIIHSQIWISYSRFQTARSKHRIVNKSLEFEQVDRERNWDDQIILTALLLYIANLFVSNTQNMPLWNTTGFLLTILLHTGPVEFLYYWFHRALHHHFLYSRYHSHHHASIVTEPITAVIHPFGEEVVYFLLFAIPILTVTFTGKGSFTVLYGYLLYIDFMNYMGHCNLEIIPAWLFKFFPPLKYLMYTPSFHSLHHTKFRTNYSLFMPLYDYLYGTTDKCTEELYEGTLKGKEEVPQVVHLTHPTSLLSLYHLRVGFASLASRPYGDVARFKWLMWPMTCWSFLLTWFCRSPFAVERNRVGEKITTQTWVVPRFGFQYLLSWERKTINDLIEKAIRDAEDKGTSVLSLGLYNQDEEVNRNGEIYIAKNPKLRLRIVDGSCLAVASVLNTIPQGIKQVIVRGKLSKVALFVVKTLSQRSTKIVTIRRTDFEALKLRLPANTTNNLVLSDCHSAKVWLVGDGLSEEEQKKADRGTRFIPFSQYPPKKYRSDCFYNHTPSMVIPNSMENVHSCENWLPRRVLSAWRVAGIVHALEGWKVHEVGDVVLDVDKAWAAALSHGFLPFEAAME